MIYVLGLDVSHWNGVVDWDGWYNKGYRYVFIKVSEGTGWQDPAWQKYHDLAKKAGYLVGPYHYFRSDYNGIAQGAWMYNVAKDARWDFGPVLDVESNHANLGTAAYAARVRAALNEMRTLFNRQPIVYTSRSKWKYTGNTVVDADLWVAHYTSASSPAMPIGFLKWLFWQYTSTPIDQNRFSGSMDDLKKYAGIELPPPPPDLEPRVHLLETVVDGITSWIRSF